MYSSAGQFHDSGVVAEPTLVLPEAMGRYVNKHLQVAGVFPGDCKTTSVIRIAFDDGFAPRPVFLWVGVKHDDKTGVTTMYHPEPGSDIDEGLFRNWSKGASQQYVRERLTQLETDIKCASEANAYFLTTAASSRDLVALGLGGKEDSVLKTLLAVELPYLSGVSMSELAKARQNEAAFEEFRAAFGKAFQEVESLPAEDQQRKVDEVLKDLVHAPVSRIDAKMKAMKSTLWLDAAITTGTFVGTILTGGKTLLGAALWGAAGVLSLQKAIDRYSARRADAERIREYPSFFYWEATKGARARKKD